jgi:hypothetical protein
MGGFHSEGVVLILLQHFLPLTVRIIPIPVTYALQRITLNQQQTIILQLVMNTEFVVEIGVDLESRRGKIGVLTVDMSEILVL